VWAFLPQVFRKELERKRKRESTTSFDIDKLVCSRELAEKLVKKVQTAAVLSFLASAFAAFQLAFVR
jgi:hypothetical protein